MMPERIRDGVGAGAAMGIAGTYARFAVARAAFGAAPCICSASLMLRVVLPSGVLQTSRARERRMACADADCQRADAGRGRGYRLVRSEG